MEASKKPQYYKGKTYAYPPDNLDPRKKLEKQYYLDVNNALYADYVNNRLAVPYSYANIDRTNEELRLYATGRQSPNKIKKWLLKANPDGTFNTKMNVSYDGYAKLPQLLDMMRSRYMNQEFDVSLSCIDEDSAATIEATRQMMRFIIDSNTQKFLETAMYTPDIQPDPKELGLLNKEDVDEYINSGGFTLQWQIAAEAACAKSKMESDYKPFQDQIMDDLIINRNGICGAKTYIEKSTGIPKFRRVEITRALIQPSNYRNFKDNTIGGEIRLMSMTDISRENPQITPQQLYDIAMSYQWMNRPLLNSPYTSYEDWAGSRNRYSSTDPVMSAKVYVLDANWLSIDDRVTIKNSRGFVKTVDLDYKLTAKDAKNGDEKIQKKVIRKYESQWIVGTDILLNYGPCEDVVYYGPDGNKRPRIDYFFAQTGNMSLIERCVALVDDMNMILVKHRNGWASLPASPALVIQTNLIENVMLNGKAQTQDELISTFIERGVLAVNGLDDNGNPLFMAGGQKPIEFLDVSKMASVMSVCSQELALKANELRDVLGLNNGADGGSTSPYQGLGETELAIQTANSSLQPTFNSYAYLFKDIFTDIIKKWQIVSKRGNVKVPYSILGEKSMKMLSLGSEFTNSEFNVEISIAPSAEEKRSIMQNILQLRMEKSLTASQFIYLQQKVMSGQIKAAYFQLGKMEARRERQLQAQKMQDVEANGAIQQQSLLAKGQLDGELLTRKGQMEMERTLVKELLQSNRELINEIVKTRKPDDVPPNAALAEQIILQNTEDVGEVLMGAEDEMQPQPEMQPEPEMEQQPI